MSEERIRNWEANKGKCVVENAEFGSRSLGFGTEREEMPDAEVGRVWNLGLVSFFYSAFRLPPSAFYAQ